MSEPRDEEESERTPRVGELLTATDDAEQWVEELPAARAGRGAEPLAGHWGEIRDLLRRHPGIWRRVASAPRTPRNAASATYIRQALERPSEDGGAFKAAVRSIKGEVQVFARYLSENTDGVG